MGIFQAAGRIGSTRASHKIKLQDEYPSDVLFAIFNYILMSAIVNDMLWRMSALDVQCKLSVGVHPRRCLDVCVCVYVRARLCVRARVCVHVRVVRIVRHRKAFFMSIERRRQSQEVATSVAALQLDSYETIHCGLESVLHVARMRATVVKRGCAMKRGGVRARRGEDGGRDDGSEVRVGMLVMYQYAPAGAEPEFHIYLSIYLSIYIYLSFYLSIYLSIYPSISIHPSIYLSIYLYIYLLCTSLQVRDVPRGAGGQEEPNIHTHGGHEEFAVAVGRPTHVTTHRGHEESAIAGGSGALLPFLESVQKSNEASRPLATCLQPSTAGGLQPFRKCRRLQSTTAYTRSVTSRPKNSGLGGIQTKASAFV
jgi:hypothetical protein